MYYVYVDINLTLHFVVQPAITDPLENSTNIVDEVYNTTITCTAIGYPPPTIVWSRTSGGEVSVSDSVSVPTGNGNVTSVSVNLTLTNASREETGLYQCYANNSVGSDTRNTTVTVQCELIMKIFMCKCVYLCMTNQPTDRMTISN